MIISAKIIAGGEIYQSRLTEVSRTTLSQAPTRTVVGTRKTLRSPGCIGFQEDLYRCRAPYSDQVFPTLRIPPFYAGS